MSQRGNTVDVIGSKAQTYGQELVMGLMMAVLSGNYLTATEVPKVLWDLWRTVSMVPLVLKPTDTQVSL